MTQINVKIKNDDKIFIFEVEIEKDGKNTKHEVTLDKDFYKQKVGESVTPSELVEKSFEFLLKRESAEAILREFNLEVISDYFPEFENYLNSLKKK